MRCSSYICNASNRAGHANDADACMSSSRILSFASWQIVMSVLEFSRSAPTRLAVRFPRIDRNSRASVTLVAIPSRIAIVSDFSEITTKMSLNKDVGSRISYSSQIDRRSYYLTVLRFQIYKNPRYAGS